MDNELIILKDCLGLPDVGGKASSLSVMLNAGFSVPQGYLVNALVKNAEAISLPIFEAFDSLHTDRVAVRSSALSEDSENESWAGQFETQLNITKDSLLVAVNDCRTPGRLKRAKSYSRLTNKADIEHNIPVIIQTMIDADISGVLFTANPITKNIHEIILESVYGLGESLVQGIVIPESLSIDKNNGRVITRTSHRQTNKHIYANNQAQVVPLSSAELNNNILSDEQIQQLFDLTLKIENIFGVPQDIEWCFHKNKLYVLQSRPITTLT